MQIPTFSTPHTAPPAHSYTTQRDLSDFLQRLLDMERLATAQEWWMYGRVLPEARRIAELTCLLAAARAELVSLLKSLGFPQAVEIDHPGTSELIFASHFTSDDGWAQAHRAEAHQVLQLAAMAVPVLLVQAARIVSRLDSSVSGAMARRVMARITARLTESRMLAMGY